MEGETQWQVTGKPTDNAFAEAFSSRVRTECMNAHWFLTLADARQKVEAWRRYYNEDHPHGSIDYKPPIASQNSGDVASRHPDRSPKTLPSGATMKGSEQGAT
jgi:transposase InsO family protein